MELIICIIKMYFNFSVLDINLEKKEKVRNEEKIIQEKKEIIQEQCRKKPASLSSRVKEYILREKVFTLKELKKEFSDFKPTTINGYVYAMKKEGVLLEIGTGKYALL